MIDYRDQIAMIKFYHLVLIFLAIYFQNICDETFAESLVYQDKYPEICYKNANYSNHKITCKHDVECNNYTKIPKYKSRHPQMKAGVCVHARNNKEK